MPIDLDVIPPTLLYCASLGAYEDDGMFYFVATWVGGGEDESKRTSDKMVALQWLSERAFPTVDFRKGRRDE